MTRRVDLTKLQDSLDHYLTEVEEKSAHFIIERDGVPVAAIVPLKVEENFQAERKAFFDNMRAIGKSFEDVPEEELEKLVNEAIKEFREEEYAKDKK